MFLHAEHQQSSRLEAKTQFANLSLVVILDYREDQMSSFWAYTAHTNQETREQIGGSLACIQNVN